MKHYSIVQAVKLTALILFLGGCQRSGNHQEKFPGDTLRIVFTGDLLLDRGVRKVIQHQGVDKLFSPYIDSLFAASDIVVANLECPATKIHSPINKRFIFRAEPEWLGTLKKHGITHLNLANNHSMDQGRDGLADTEKQIIDAGMFPIGFGRNATEACAPFRLAQSPRYIYILSALQVPSENWPFLENKPCVCESGIDDIIRQIRQLKKNDTDAVVLVTLHWGGEHTLEPMPLQQFHARRLIEAGAEAVIGHHTHTLQSHEYYRGKPIFYSIGNFIFDQTKPINSRAALVQAIVTTDSVTFSLEPFHIVFCRPDK